jgi:hypothetical protein
MMPAMLDAGRGDLAVMHRFNDSKKLKILTFLFINPCRNNNIVNDNDQP